MIRVLVVDDEKPARDRLRRLLEVHPDVEVLGEAGNGLEALSMAAALGPELILLDIQMPELDGLGVAQALGASGPAIVFATAYDRYALEAFDRGALDYLVKPIVSERLAKALERYRAKTQAVSPRLAQVIRELSATRTNARIVIKSGSKFIVVDPDEVIAIVSEHHCAVIKGPKPEILSDDGLNILQAKLPPEFLRIHRSAIINSNKLYSLDRQGDRKYFAIMRGQDRLRLPISRERLAEVKTFLEMA